MPVLRNISPLGELDLPLIYRQGDPIGEEGAGCLEPGERFDVSTEHARILLEQPANYEPVDAAAKKIHAALFPEPVNAGKDPKPARKTGTRRRAPAKKAAPPAAATTDSDGGEQ
ncbi:MAG TPA: hypothetical protein VGH54_21610 [Mycobacterium sp.]|uniref:hypothetical protein n=1 Tax=Mycobacterium sp. TaxID=1785 RepID=UPI002F3E8B53